MGGREGAAGRLVALVAALLLLGVLVAVDGGIAGEPWRSAATLPLRAALLVAGLGLVVVALGGRATRPAVEWARGDRAALVAITAAAFAIRAWRLDALRVLIDEGNSIDALFHAFGTGPALLLPPSQYVTTMAYPGLQALSVELAGPTLVGLRLASAALGAVTVPALWWLARGLFDRPTAFAAAIVLAGFAPHVHFSRVGLPHIADALFGTLALAGLAAGLAGAGRSVWAAAGVALGLTHYGFEAGRWFFTPLAVVWLAVLAPARRRAAADGLVTAAAAWLMTVVPIYAALLAASGASAPRLTQSALGGAEAVALLGDRAALGSRLALAAGVFLWQPERAHYYGSDAALLTPLLAPFAMLGLALSLARPRAPAVLIGLWLVATWLANVIMRDPAVYARWVVVLPALALAIGRGVGAATAWAATARHATAAGAAAVGLAVVLAAAQLHGYFGGHIAQLAAEVRRAKPERDAIDVALRVDAVRPGAATLVVAEPIADVHPPRSLLRLLRAGRGEVQFDAAIPSAVDDAFLAALPTDRDRLFAVAPDDRQTVARLARCFALDGPHRPAEPLPADEQLDLYLAPAGSRRPGCGG